MNPSPQKTKLQKTSPQKVEAKVKQAKAEVKQDQATTGRAIAGRTIAGRGTETAPSYRSRAKIQRPSRAMTNRAMRFMRGWSSEPSDKRLDLTHLVRVTEDRVSPIRDP